MRRLPATREEVRETILDSVDRLLARYGYRKMTIDDVAREAGIGKGTVYLFFESKEELALSRIDRIIDRVQRRLREIAGSSEPIPDRIRKMLVERVLARFDSVHHHNESIDDILAAIRPSLLQRRERYFALEAKIFAEVLREGKRDGSLRALDPVPTAETLLVATNSLLPGSLSSAQLGSRRSIEIKVTRVANLLVDGLIA